MSTIDWDGISKIPDERMRVLVAMDQHFTEEINKAKHELETYLKAQHNTRREIFNLQFEMRHGK